MIAVRATVPVACWRKGHAREFLETERVPPPSTCYGMLLSMVGETDRTRHRGARVTGGVVGNPEISTILRTTWRIKSTGESQGSGQNAKPDFQQLVVQADLIVLCDSSEEPGPQPTLEDRVRRAFEHPASITRFGGLSLGESTHLVNDLWLLSEELPAGTRLFLLEEDGTMTLPVWVDHVGSAGTRYAVGNLEETRNVPSADRVPRIGSAA